MRRLLFAVALVSLGLVMPARAQTPDTETYLNSAENRMRTGNIDGALADLTRAIALDPKNADVYRYRGLLRIEQGNHALAIADFTQAIALNGKKAENYVYRSAAKRQSGDADGAIADARRAVELEPKLEMAHGTLYKTYLDRAYRDTSLSSAQKRDYVARGVDAVSAALRQIPTSVEATMYKALYLRVQASLEVDATKQKALIKEATDLDARAQQLIQRRADEPPAPARPYPFLDLPPRPPPPPPLPSPPPLPAPPASPLTAAPVRVGGKIQPPTKTKDVPPVYPPAAIKSRTQGQVILEAVIDERGRVADVKIVRSIPALDTAALDAVRQWRYTPTIVNGVAVRVIMSVTVTFALK